MVRSGWGEVKWCLKHDHRFVLAETVVICDPLQARGWTPEVLIDKPCGNGRSTTEEKGQRKVKPAKRAEVLHRRRRAGVLQCCLRYRWRLERSAGLRWADSQTCASERWFNPLALRPDLPPRHAFLSPRPHIGPYTPASARGNRLQIRTRRSALCQLHRCSAESALPELSGSPGADSDEHRCK